MGTVNTINDIKPYSTKDLAGFYEVSIPTFRKWLIPFSVILGDRTGRYYSVVQVKVIFEKLGVPCKYEINADSKRI